MAKVYVGTHRRYNNGDLFGAWLDLEDYNDIDDFYGAVNGLHIEELDEYEDIEPMFQDWEGIPDGLIDESWISEIVFEYLALSDYEQEIIDAWCVDESLDSYGLSDILEKFAGTANSPAEFAEQIAIDCGEIPKDLASWIVIDWESSWNCNLRFDYSEVYYQGQYYFFLNS